MKGGFFTSGAFSDDDDSFDEEEKKQQPQRRFLDLSSDESEEEQRVVRSAKDKRWDTIQGIGKRVKQHVKIHDFVSLLRDFEELLKEHTRAQGILEKEGLPAFFTRALVRMDDTVSGITKEEAKKMNANNNRSYNRLKQQLKKNLRQFQDEIDLYRENPVLSEPSEEEMAPEDDDLNDDESDWDSDDDEESDDDEVFDNRGNDPETRRRFWEIKDKGKSEEKKKTKVKSARPKRERDFSKMQDQDKDYSSISVMPELAKIKKKWGRIRVDNKEQMAQLIEYRDNCTEDVIIIQTLDLLIPTIFNLWENSATIAMPEEDWNQAILSMEQLLKYYKSRANLLQGELIEIKQRLEGSYVQHIERLNSELRKMLRNADLQGDQYARIYIGQYRLSDMIGVLLGIYKDQPQQQARLYSVQLELCYYLTDPLYEKIKQGTAYAQSYFFQMESPSKEVDRLSSFIYQNSNHQDQYKAMLMHTFNLALNGNYAKANQLFLSTAHQRPKEKNDQLQVLYNRAVVMLGLSAFYNGFYKDSLQLLDSIVSTHKIGQLLGQFISKDKAKGMQREYQKRLLPFHMHINVELIESAYILSCMLVDIPIYAQHQQDPYKNSNSNSFRQFMEIYSRKLPMPPEGHRDYIFNACNYMRQSDWKKCFELVENLSTWNFVPENVQFKDTLLKGIKQSALSVFLNDYNESYPTITKQQLSYKFQLADDEIFNLVNNMIDNNQIQGQWKGDQLEIQRQSYSKIQFLYQLLSERTNESLKLIQTIQKNAGVFEQLGVSEIATSSNIR